MNVYFASLLIPLVVLPGPAWTLSLCGETPPGAAPAQDQDPAATQREPADAEELLDLLEADSRNVTSFSTAVHRRAYDFGADETLVYIGELFYANDDGGKRIALQFRQRGTLENQPGKPPLLKLRERSEDHIFSGEWLVERNVEEKQFIKRQIVRPGDTFDPLALDGPLPLPFGQPKADVLRLFEVELIEKPADDSFLAKNLGDVYGLRLIPKPGTPAAEDFESVIIYYDRTTLLPAGLDAAKLGGNRETVWFSKQQRNAIIEPSVMDISIPTGDGWRISINEWRGE